MSLWKLPAGRNCLLESVRMGAGNDSVACPRSPRLRKVVRVARGSRQAGKSREKIFPFFGESGVSGVFPGAKTFFRTPFGACSRERNRCGERRSTFRDCWKCAHGQGYWPAGFGPAVRFSLGPCGREMEKPQRWPRCQVLRPEGRASRASSPPRGCGAPRRGCRPACRAPRGASRRR